MNNYSCTYYLNLSLPLIKQPVYCWAPLKSAIAPQIYIDPINKLTSSHKKMIKLINKITPCKIVKTEIDYLPYVIKYTFYKTTCRYHANLLLLNFIRNIWWQQSGVNNELFFKYIEEHYNDDEDPLKILTMANNESYTTKNIFNDHSNCFANSKIKTVDDFKTYFSKSYSHQLVLNKFFTP